MASVYIEIVYLFFFSFNLLEVEYVILYTVVSLFENL